MSIIYQISDSDEIQNTLENIFENLSIEDILEKSKHSKNLFKIFCKDFLKDDDKLKFLLEQGFSGIKEESGDKFDLIHPPFYDLFVEDENFLIEEMMENKEIIEYFEEYLFQNSENLSFEDKLKIIFELRQKKP